LEPNTEKDFSLIMYIPSSNLTNEIPGQHVEGMGDLMVEAPHEKAGMCLANIITSENNWNEGT
jgi:hypothetical protein